MKRNLYILIPTLLLGTTLTACSSATPQAVTRNGPDITASTSTNLQKAPDTQTATKTLDQKSSQSMGTGTIPTKVVSNNPADIPSELGAKDYDKTEVSINSNSPYQDFAAIVAHYLSMKFDTSLFKHITVDYVILAAKTTDPKTITGEVSLIVEHQTGRSSAYDEGKNTRFVSFSKLPDGSFALSSFATAPVQTEVPVIQNIPSQTSSASDLPQGLVNNPNPIGNQYKISNGWQKVLGSRFVQVYAGCMANDSQQGVIVVHDNSIDFSKVNIREYPLPSNHGAAKIDSENYNILTIRNSDGTIYRFDANKLQFVSSN